MSYATKNITQWVTGIGTISTSTGISSSQIISNTLGAFADVQAGATIKIGSSLVEVIHKIDDSTIMVAIATSANNSVWSYKNPTRVESNNDLPSIFTKPSSYSIGINGHNINPSIQLTGFGSGPLIKSTLIGGHVNNPLRTGNNSPLLQITGLGNSGLYGISAGGTAGISMRASEFFTSTNGLGTTSGSHITLSTTSRGMNNAQNVEKVRIDGYGRVGINTTTPTGMLHVKSNISPTEVSFTTSALSDITMSGTNSSNDPISIMIQVDSVGPTDTFKWNVNGGAWTSGIPMSTSPISLGSTGISVKWGAITGHVLNGYWAVTVSGLTAPGANPAIYPTTLHDFVSSGTYTGLGGDSYNIKITSVGTPDQFQWQKNGGAWSSSINVNTSAVTYVDGIAWRWNANTGHNLGDTWSISIPIPLKVESSTGTSIFSVDNNGNTTVAGNVLSAANTELQFILSNPTHKAMHFNKGYGAGFTNNSFFMFNNIGSIDSYYPDWNGMQLWGHPVAWNIANSTWKGIWNSSTSYVANDTVILGTTAYQCINPNTNQIPPNASYWNVVTLNQFPYLNIYSRSTSPVNGTDYEYVIGALNTLGDNSYLAQSIRFKSATSSGQTNENQGQIAFDTGITNALVIGRSGDVTTKGSLIINSSDWVAGGGTVSTSGGSTLTANTTGSFSGIKDGSSIKLSNGTILEVLKVIDSSTITLNLAATLTNLTWSYKSPSAILQSNGSDFGYLKSDAAIGLKGDGVFNPKIHMHGYGGNPAVVGFRANGTSASASGVVANDTLMSVAGGGYGSSGVWSTAVNMQFKAGESWGAGSTGTYVVFNTVANGTNTATEKLRIHGSGGISIGNTVDPGANNVSITGNTTTKAVIETYVTLAASANTFTPNLSLGSTFGIPLGATNNIGTPINVPASGLVASMTLLIKQDNTGNRTINSYPASFSWGDSGQPALTTTPNKMDVITCLTVDGGVSWTCFLSGKGF